MPLYLSQSEAFWVSIFVEETKLWVAQSGVEKNGCTSEAEESRNRQAGFEVFRSLQRLAVYFGIGRGAVVSTPAHQAPCTAPEDTIWVSGSGRRLEADEVALILKEVGKEWGLAAPDGQADTPAIARLVNQNPELMRDHESKNVIGYAPSTPLILYTISVTGHVHEYKRVSPHSPGLYRDLLRGLCPYLPVPMDERMALNMPPWESNWRSDWYPRRNIEEAVGTFDRTRVAEMIQALAAANEKDPAWELGCLLSRLATNAEWALDITPNPSSCPYESISSPNQIDDIVATEHGVEQAWADAERQGTPSQSPEGAKVINYLTRFIQHLSVVVIGLDTLVPASRDAEGSEEAVNVEDDDCPSGPQIERETLEVFTGIFRQDASIAAERCRSIGLETVAEVVLSARNVVPDIATLSSVDDLSGDVWTHREAAQQFCDRFTMAERLLRMAMLQAHAELRIRQLLADDVSKPSGVSVRALGGWLKQSDNIREAIKAGMEQLDRGAKPYVVLTNLSPALEPIVRRLIERHHSGFDGTKLEKMLDGLKQKFKDDEERQALVRILYALKSLRNRTQHADDGLWQREHAMLFLNGLSIALSYT
jgi:hypothetical protein